MQTNIVGYGERGLLVWRREGFTRLTLVTSSSNFAVIEQQLWSAEYNLLRLLTCSF